MCDILALAFQKVAQRFKGRGIRVFFFYPIINMTEERATAPENWTEPPVSCCGQRAPHYPQCTTCRLLQRHNTMLTTCLHSIGLRLSFFFFFFVVAYNEFWFLKIKTNKYNMCICSNLNEGLHCPVSALNIFWGNS